MHISNAHLLGKTQERTAVIMYILSYQKTVNIGWCMFLNSLNYGEKQVSNQQEMPIF